MKIDPYLSLCTKLKSKWIKDLNINLNTLNLIEEKVGNSLQDMGTGDQFLHITFCHIHDCHAGVAEMLTGWTVAVGLGLVLHGVVFQVVPWQSVVVMMPPESPLHWLDLAALGADMAVFSLSFCSLWFLHLANRSDYSRKLQIQTRLLRTFWALPHHSLKPLKK